MSNDPIADATAALGNAPAADVAANSAPAPSATAPAAVSTGAETVSSAPGDAAPSSSEPAATPAGPGEVAAAQEGEPLHTGGSTSPSEPGSAAEAVAPSGPLAWLDSIPQEGAALVHELLVHIEEGFTEISISLGFERLKALREKVAAKL